MFRFLSASLLAFPALIAPFQTQEPVQDRELLAMGTRLSLHLEGSNLGHSAKAAERFLAEVERIETAASTWRPESAWSRLNAARGEARPLDAEWIRLLSQAQTWSQETESAFDPVLMALLRAWGLREGGRTPSALALAQAKSASGSSLLRVNAKEGTVQLLHPDAGLEEGAFLKGYALDSGRRVAEAEGAGCGLLDFGGQLLAWGRAFEVEIAQPRNRQQARLRLRLENASLSSSGCSERGRHILDPRRGEPCPDWGAVSVVAPSAFDADVLSTALFVMGPAQGSMWAARHGIAAIFLSHDGSVRMSPAFERLNPTFLSPEKP